jgi:hypothetical protein
VRLPKQTQPVRFPVPLDLRHDVGLGDAIKGLTTKIGITPCAPCQQRAAALNRHVTFTGRPQPRR